MTSPNFDFSCRCGCGIDGIAPHLRAAFAQLCAISPYQWHVLSAIRCPKHNARIGGSPSSFHLEGLALDITAQGASVLQMATDALKVEIFARGGIIVYPSKLYIHVDCRSGPWHVVQIADIVVPMAAAFKTLMTDHILNRTQQSESKRTCRPYAYSISSLSKNSQGSPKPQSESKPS